MKTFALFAVIVIFVFTNQLFTQTNHRLKLKPNNLFEERIIPDTQFRRASESDIFQDKESRTLVNKTTLDNGFLLVESVYQTWDDFEWRTYQRYLYTYNEYNYRVENLYQLWQDSTWENSTRFLYSYDGKNNLVESLKQNCD